MTTFYRCLVLLSVAVIKKTDQKQLGEERVIWNIGYSSSLREIKARSQESEAGAMEKECLLADSSQLAQPTFLPQPKITCTKWAGPHHQLSKKMHHKHAHEPICWKKIFQLFPSLQVTLFCVKLTKKLTSTTFNPL